MKRDAFTRDAGRAQNISSAEGSRSVSRVDAMRRVKDAFDPPGLMNPGKIFPTPSRCREFAFASTTR